MLEYGLGFRTRKFVPGETDAAEYFKLHIKGYRCVFRIFGKYLRSTPI